MYSFIIIFDRLQLFFYYYLISEHTGKKKSFYSQSFLRMSFMSDYVECRSMRVIKFQQVNKQALFVVWQTWFDPLSLAETCCCSDWNVQHELPVCQKANFKILMLVFEALNGLELKSAALLTVSAAEVIRVRSGLCPHNQNHAWEAARILDLLLESDPAEGIS